MPWYEEWFDRDEYELVYSTRDEREAEPIIDLLERVAAPPLHATILDVGCGRGRHARSLARRGYQVTGVDLSERALEKARQLTALEDLQVHFQQGDMREPVCQACFDGVVNLFTAFGYFEDEADHGRAIDAMATALRPGGWFLQDFLNASFVADTLIPEDTRREGDLELTQRRWLSNGRINKEITIHRCGTTNTHTFHESVRLFTLPDLQALYTGAGLDLVHTFGDYEGNAHTPSSPRLILFARKR